MCDTDKAKEYLCQIPKADRLITQLTNTVVNLRSSLTSVNTELKHDKVQTSGPKDTMAETIAKIIDLEKEINQRIDTLVDLKKEAFRLISLLPDHDQQNVLIARYIDNKKWLDIAGDLNFSISQVYKIHGHALLKFTEQNPNLLT